ncbi:MAG: hypothetical protein PHD05_09580 [Sphaerochaetaceae bacterium]|nr:hypothetical protein [Sphaerochaetaceae bacterium]
MQKIVSLILISSFVLILLLFGCVQPPVCGDNVCNGDETSVTCSQDCGATSYCGDTICNGDETSISCPEDCGEIICLNDANCSNIIVSERICKGNNLVTELINQTCENKGTVNSYCLQGSVEDVILEECVYGCSNQSCYVPDFCDASHYCEDNTCKLKNFDYNFGLVYIYTDQNNYNSSWRPEFEDILEKVEESVNSITESKVSAKFDILGESRVDTFVWNPAKIGIRCDDTYFPALGSSFLAVSNQYHCKSIEAINCPNCKIELTQIIPISNGNIICNEGEPVLETAPGQCNPEIKPFICDGNSGKLVIDCTQCGCDQGNTCDEISGNCKSNDVNLTDYSVTYVPNNSLSYQSLWSSKLGDLQIEIEDELNFSFSDYNKVFIIFGRLGTPLMSEPYFYDYKCKVLDGIIGGYSNLIMGEDSIKSGGLVDCETFGPFGYNQKFYYKEGWHAITHEILHNIGAVDVYDTGLAFGITSEKEKALKIDSRANESIMGDDERLCMANYSCSDQDLDDYYLDLYNRFNVGLPVDTHDLNEEIISLLKSRNTC